jgi:uncharacterized RDD family membrane protein YckC
MAHAKAVPVSGSKLDNRRVLAALIDLAIVVAGSTVILAAAGVLGQSDVGMPLTAVTIGWALYYYFACESGSGQTVGKRVMKIRVVGTDGAPAGMREIGLRTVLRVIDGMFVYLVGLIVMLATRERRGRLGDLVAHTMIVDAGEPAPAAAPTPAPAVAEVAPDAPRVPIGESGRAFETSVDEEPPVEVHEPVVELEPALEADEPPVEVHEPVVEDESAVEADEPAVEADEPAESAEPDFASPSLMELASDVSAVTESEDRELDEEPVADAEEEPVAELEEQPESEAGEQPEPEAGEEPEPEAAEEADDEVTVKSVETVSAMDIVMGESDQAAVDEQHAKAPQS